MAILKQVTFLAVCLFGVATLGRSSNLLCDDIDAVACKLMHDQRPDLCNDTQLAQSACPRFCNMCPIECHHCNVTVNDFHLCNTTKLCGNHEVCMIKQLKSFVDGHSEYEMTCEDPYYCDGSDLTFHFGKRHMELRDVSVKCCRGDLCNYPEEPTTTTTTTTTATPTTTHRLVNCHKDILFLIDESSNLIANQNEVLNFVSSVVQDIPIGLHDSLVTLATYNARTAQKRWDLNTYTTQATLLNAISSVQFNGGAASLNPAIHYAVNTKDHRLQAPSAPYVIVFIAAEGGSSLSTQQYASQLASVSNDIIVIDIGRQSNQYIASDRRHEIHVTDPATLSNIEQQVVNLICSRSTPLSPLVVG